MGEIERGRKVLVPPFLKPQKEEKKTSREERRLRAKAIDEVEKGSVKINKSIAEEYGQLEEVEIVGGERRRTFKALADEKIPQQEVWLNPEDLRSLGIAEGTIVTVRKTK
ncbi:hypothetical protein TUZN_1943 [Thermoproteus uzoniensis 768-20]|uniref:CDC48 N-terminal subdomain domain-containing protein n=1 Tax=Thermoproteus uzoniensis (strain 768-20) TaxID=999630 RepID=F2L4H0_THEU7|nr:hypothetical protein [Thermoproteus uzoniensis]AEA13402.1 hypothetical protein TUZN_1943 [Thermoproteus uzoniensis 768-20]